MRAFLVALLVEVLTRAYYEIFAKHTSEDEMAAPVDLERRAKFLAAVELYEPQSITQSPCSSPNNGRGDTTIKCKR